MKIRALLVTLLLSMTAFAQDATLTLGDCRQLAHDNYPTIRQRDIIQQSKDFSIANISKGWLPQISISAGASAFTDIIDSDSRASQMGVDMENYMLNATVTIQQNIYDGGKMRAKRLAEKARSESDAAQLEVSLYEVNERVEQLFFGILLADEKSKINALVLTDLSTAEKTIVSMIKGGLADDGDLEAIQVERLKIEQQQESLTTARAAYLEMLGIFIGRELDNKTVLEKPATSETQSDYHCARPELQCFSAQQKMLDSQTQQLNSQLRPTLKFIGAGIVHSDVTPLVNNNMLVGSIQFSWSIGALYTRKNDLRQIHLKQLAVDSQRETFLFNTRLQTSNVNGTIVSLQKQMDHDSEIVRLRESIMQRTNRKVEAGTESVNELVRNINAVALARQQMALHEIELLQETYRLKNINNNY